MALSSAEGSDSDLLGRTSERVAVRTEPVRMPHRHRHRDGSRPRRRGHRHPGTRGLRRRRARVPLVGGGEHDWAYLFGRFGLLNQDTAIARSVRALGGLVFLVALVRGYLAATRPAPADGGDAVDAVDEGDGTR